MAKARRKFRGRKKGKRGALAIAKKALRRTALNRPELKAITLNIADPDVSVANIFVNIINLPQGLDADERVGHEVRVRGVQVRGSLFSTAGAGVGHIIRMTVIQDTQQVGDTAPAISAVFSDSGNIGSLLSYNTQSKGKRFRVLADKTMTVVQDASNAERTLKWFKKMNSRVMFNGGLGSDLQRGGLFLRIWSNAAAASTLVFADLFVRVFYTDS